MKNKLFLDLIRTIKKSFGKYITLLLIVLLGVSFFSGMLSISAAMGQSVDRYVDEYNLFDFQIYSNYGFSTDDIEALNELDENLSVQAGYLLDAEGSFGETDYVFRLESFDLENDINKVNLVEGRYPENPNEALAEIPSGLFVTPKIGETVSIHRASMELDDVLLETEFEIVGIVSTPNYMSQEKGFSTLDNLTLSSFLYVPNESFKGDFYTTVYVKSEKAESLDSFSVSYEEQTKIDEEILADFAETQQGKNAETIKSDATKEYQDGLNEYQDGLSEFETEIENAQKKIDDGFTEINNAETEINNSISELNSSKDQLSALPTSSQTSAALSEIEATLAVLEENKAELELSKSDLETSQTELNEQKEEGQNELDDALSKLQEAETEISELEDGKWTILTHDEHYSMTTYKDTVNQMQVIGLIFPIFFFLVAALVCLTTMTRMVDEQRGQIGVLRALGYSRLSCASKYLLYALSATIIGGLIGALVGVMLFPPIVFTTWGIIYNLPALSFDFPWFNMLLAIGIFVVVMGLTTFSAIRIETKDVASNLLRPKAPPAGKKVFLEKISFIWKRLSFTNKVTARNIIRYKKRFFMTITGIAGCTCLLVSGFGMSSSIGSIGSLQYDDLTLNDGLIMTEEGTDENDFNELVSSVNSLDSSISAIAITSYATKLTFNSGEAVGYVQVFENDEKLKEMNVVRERNGKTELFLDDNSILISEKLSELIGANVGDEVLIESNNEESESVVIGGIYEKYINHEIYMSDACYENLFGESISDNAVVFSSDLDENVFEEKALALPNVIGISFNSAISSSFENISESMNIVIIIIIISAASLAFVVLSNLANINISERKREIATLKVLGFRHKETKEYIFKESLIITLFGALLGSGLGVIAHNFIITQVEMDFLMFIRIVSFDSIIYSVILTFVFSIFVNRFMLSKLKKIDMIESLKSVE